MTAALTLEVATNDDMLTITAHGDLDLTTCHHLLAATTDATATNTVATIVLDLTDLGFCDSAGLGALVRIHRAGQRYNRLLILHAPAPDLRRMLEITGLTEVFVIEP
ncbi:STAS domain-containing protein [Dactylosporangium roseum]|uniref:Anti-sigma factor antagonist n=1 Tax=Dactylosporangium roseum TaxID=47989 RepID=A0ABY5ZFX0_9ACTN|nr:STAS domain-containing protein [Dactylosporangium roseum]UWZ39642.1 STAS domain-containing protein [Dactylosporangium roseum]